MNRVKGEFEKIRSRNKKLLSFFTSKGLNVRIVGEKEPMIILDDKLLLSCFINGTTLHFLQSPGSGNVVKSINLSKEIFFTDFELNEVLNTCTHMPVYQLRMTNTDLKLVGFNNTDEDEGERTKRYPVFALHRPFIYTDLEKARKVHESLINQGYNVEIV